MRLPLVKGWKNKIVRTVRRAARASPLASRAASRATVTAVRWGRTRARHTRETRDRRRLGCGARLEHGRGVLLSCLAVHTLECSRHPHSPSLSCALVSRLSRAPHRQLVRRAPPAAAHPSIPPPLLFERPPTCSHSSHSLAGAYTWPQPLPPMLPCRILICRILMPRRPRHRRAI